MTAEIIEFTATPRPKHVDRSTDRRVSEGISDILRDWIVTDKTAGMPPPTTTTTGKNARLRSARWEVWRRADAVTDYWDALLNFHGAVLRAKRHGLKEARAHVEISEEGRWSILESYREVLNKHLLTPAPDVASVNWKRHKMREYGVKKELVEKAIADDIAFLDAHPTRNSRANKLG
jgi:hypothetical protein